jgi:hypothetical protein
MYLKNVQNYKYIRKCTTLTIKSNNTTRRNSHMKIQKEDKINNGEECIYKMDSFNNTYIHCSYWCNDLDGCNRADIVLKSFKSYFFYFLFMFCRLVF